MRWSGVAQSETRKSRGSGAVWRPRSAHVTVRSGRSTIVVHGLHVLVASRGGCAVAWTGGDGDQTNGAYGLGFFWHEWNVAVPRHLASKFGQSERSARESRGTLDENLRREEHCEHAEKRDDEHLQQLCRQSGK